MQPEAQTTVIPARNKPSVGKLLLWLLLGLVLLYAAWMTFDLFTHPFEAGANRAVGSPNLFRWLSFAAGLFSLTIALFIVRRVPGNPVGPLLILWSVGALGWSTRTEYATLEQAAWASLVFNLYFSCIASPAVVLLLFYFPTGKTYPKWLDRLMIPFAFLMGISGLLAIIGSPPFTLSGMPNPIYRPGFAFGPVIYPAVFILLSAGAMVSLGLRYRQGSSRERLQLRWFLWLLAMVILTTLISNNPVILPLGLPALLLFKVIVFIFWQSFAAVAIGITLLRHRLWDIDILIRRTLVYGVLTAALLVLYFTGVIALQELFQLLTGQHQSSIATVLSTLAIAALFNPLRKRIQNTIDHRFYRRRYNAEQTLQAFAATLRDEVDIEQLSNHLVAVVLETMQPESVSLWLKDQGMRRSEAGQ